MIGYMTIGALDVEASLPFYDAVLGAIGYERQFFEGGWGGYGLVGKQATIFIVPPHDGQTARPGNGIMPGFYAPTKEAVVAAYQAGLARGGKDETDGGAPGPRPPGSTTWWGAYLRDPTGNKFSVFTVPKD